ncbi:MULTISPECIES: hypothetical protein [Variovorax]|uniref:hypothetical protein n=1 Tax=Variovorax TaxID=34072 RepID=UPI0021ABE719|nr:hypothetical protein [Variovorax paradoxus]UVH56740.1 hypothetical protein NWF24_28495 [Variovorax paradoxus]
MRRSPNLCEQPDDGQVDKPSIYSEIAQAEEYELKGWVVLRRTKVSKGRETYGQQTVYAQITDAGRRALEETAA